MRPNLIVVLLAGLLVLVGASALAQPSDVDLDACLDIPEEELFRGPPSCTFDSHGNLISRQYPDDAFGGFSFGGFSFGTFLVIALLWAGVPLLIAGSVASDRGESVGVAVGLTLVLGWIGLAIVLFGLHNTSEKLGEVAAPGVAAARAADPGADPVAERLRRLEDLRARGLITEEELQQRRSAVLDEV